PRPGGGRAPEAGAGGAPAQRRADDQGAAQASLISAVVRSPWSRLSLALLAASGSHLWFYGLTNLTPTVSLVELEWSLSALIGVLYSIDFLRDNLTDWRLLVGPQEAECLVIEILILVGVVLLGLHLLLLSLGLLAMTSLPSVAVPTLRI